MKGQASLKLAAGLVAASLLLAAGKGVSRTNDFAFGADLSFLKQAEARGAVFKDGTNAAPGLQIFRQHGYNWIRLRLFVQPVGGHLPNDLPYTIASAQDAKKLGYKFLLDFHYANVWADPRHQPTPANWVDLSHAQRVVKVSDYTRDTLRAFSAAGVWPDMVQLGNEITAGLLWPDGILPDHWDNVADYLRAGRQGVQAGCGTNACPKVMIHIDTGGSLARTKYFLDKLMQYHIAYDVLGLSYYPWWQGSLENLRTNLDYTARIYGKDIIVVETAYPWKPTGESAGRTHPFPETPAGQRDFLDAVTRVVMQTPQGRGWGIFWWEPAVPLRDGLAARGFFDENGNSLPVLTVFDKYAGPAPKMPGQ